MKYWIDDGNSHAEIVAFEVVRNRRCKIIAEIEARYAPTITLESLESDIEAALRKPVQP